MEILKNLGIETLPPKNLKVSIKEVTESNETYFFAHVYSDMGVVNEYLGSLIAFNGQSLAEQLKNVYGYNLHLKKRTFDNFYDWYSKFGYVPVSKIMDINDKFKN